MPSKTFVGTATFPNKKSRMTETRYISVKANTQRMAVREAKRVIRKSFKPAHNCTIDVHLREPVLS